MLIKYIFSKSTFATLIVTLYLILSFLFYVVERSNKPIISISLVLISFFSGFYTILQHKLSIHNNNKITLYIFFYLIIVTIGYLNKTFSIDSIYFLAAPAFAYFVSRSVINTRVLYLVLICIYSYLIKLSLSSSDGEELNLVFEMASRNVFSVIAITSTVLVYLISIKQNEIIYIWPAVITFLISVLSVGRSGIITSLFLLIGLIYIYINKRGLKFRLVMLFCILVPCIFIIILKYNEFIMIFDNIDTLSHLTKDGFESAERSEVLSSYLSNLNFLNFFTGVNYSNIFIFQHLEMNPHNSFIRFHYFTGIVSIIFFIYCFKASYYYFRSTKLVFIIFLTLLLRGWTDAIFFFSFYDFLIYLLIFQTNKFTKVNAQIHI
jgi:hypothetical protein